jgi:HK97 family phage major capsid protein
MAIKALVEARAKLAAKQLELKKVWEEAGEDRDLSKVVCLGATLDQKGKIEAIESRNNELNDLFADVERWGSVEKAEMDQKRRQMLIDSGEPSEDLPVPTPTQQRREGVKSLGQQIMALEGFKDAFKHKHMGPWEMADFEMKTVLSTTAGWAPESLRINRVAEYAAQNPRVIDLVPVTQTGMAAVKYMEETTQTNSAAARAEAGAYGEAALAYTERTVPVENISVVLPVTDQQLEDVDRIQSWIDARLRLFINRKLDYYLVNGSGVSPQIFGYLAATNLQTEAVGVNATPTAAYNAITKVRAVGFAEPSGFIMHPNDWRDIATLQDVNGRYIFGEPGSVIPQRMWGLPIALTTEMTENTGLVGAFTDHSELVVRKGITVEIGYNQDDFTKGKKSIRAEMRAALVIYRGLAFCQITGL